MREGPNLVFVERHKHSILVRKNDQTIIQTLNLSFVS